MSKSFRFVFPLLLAALVLGGCAKKQGPTPSSGMMGSDSLNAGSGDIVTGSDLGAFGSGLEGLEPRGLDGDGLYNGRERVEGILPSVYFGFDQSSIASTERNKLQQAADHLSQNPTDGLLVEGHCDWYGTAEYNLALGDRRASSVRDYLITLGVSSGRIEVLSKGDLESTPGLSKTESGQDRKADLVILK